MLAVVAPFRAWTTPGSFVCPDMYPAVRDLALKVAPWAIQMLHEVEEEEARLGNLMTYVEPILRLCLHEGAPDLVSDLRIDMENPLVDRGIRACVAANGSREIGWLEGLHAPVPATFLAAGDTFDQWEHWFTRACDFAVFAESFEAEMPEMFACSLRRYQWLVGALADVITPTSAVWLEDLLLVWEHDRYGEITDAVRAALNNPKW